MEAGGTAGAVHLLKGAVDHARGSEGGTAIDLSVCLTDLATVYEALGKEGKARVLHLEAQEKWERGWWTL